MKKAFIVSSILIVLLLVLAFASIETTGVIWDGGFPSAEFRLIVLDENSQPIQGAILHVYEHKKRELAFKYPLDNYTSDRDLVSDKDGSIVTFHVSRGMEFGGLDWKLFWIFPMGRGAPEFDCEITAAGYKSHKFGFGRLYKTSSDPKELPVSKVTVDGKTRALPIYDHTFALLADRYLRFRYGAIRMSQRIGSPPSGGQKRSTCNCVAQPGQK